MAKLKKMVLLFVCLFIITSCRTVDTSDNYGLHAVNQTNNDIKEEKIDLIKNDIKKMFPDAKADDIKFEIMDDTVEVEDWIDKKFKENYLTVSPNPTSSDAIVTIYLDSKGDFTGRKFNFDLYYENRKINKITGIVEKGNTFFISRNYIQAEGVYTIALLEFNIKGRNLSTSFIVKK